MLRRVHICLETKLLLLAFSLDSSLRWNDKHNTPVIPLKKARHGWTSQPWRPTVLFMATGVCKTMNIPPQKGELSLRKAGGDEAISARKDKDCFTAFAMTR